MKSKISRKQLKEMILKVYAQRLTESALNEDLQNLDGNDLKVLMRYINGLSALGNLFEINDKFLRSKASEISANRIEMMNYIEKNSDFNFDGSRGTGWKLVKK